MTKVLQTKSKIEIGIPVNPATLISAETQTVTKVTRATTGGMAGGRKVYYGNITKEDHLYVSFEDVITGETFRIGHNFIQEIQDDVVIAKQVTDTTKHKNSNRKECNKAETIRWLELPKHAKVEFIPKYNYSLDASVEKILEIQIVD